MKDCQPIDSEVAYSAQTLTWNEVVKLKPFEVQNKVIVAKLLLNQEPLTSQARVAVACRVCYLGRLIEEFRKKP